MARRYAAKTDVAPERSMMEIKNTLRRYGGKDIFTWDRDKSATIGFVMSAMQVRITIPLPLPDDEEFTTSDRGRKRSRAVAMKAWEQAIRQRWRALLLAIKAKLETVELGISDLETEFLSYIVTANDQTVGEQVLPRLKELARDGRKPLMLPDFTQ